MKIECSKEDIAAVVGIAEKISGRNLTLPVLNGILLKAKGNILTIRATNLDIGVEIKISCKVIKEGSVVVPGNILSTTLSYNSNENITLENINDNLFVSTKSSKTTIKSYPKEDFPTLPKVNTNNSFKIKTENLLSGIKAVFYSASNSTIKPELSSIYVYYKEGKMVFVATDSFRLAEKIITVESLSEFEPFLLPIQNIPEIIRVLEQAEKEIEILLSANQIAFVFNKTYLTSRLIDGIFPDYKQIIPKESTTEITVLKEDLLNILKKTTIFSDKFNQIHFSIQTSKKNFTLHSKNSDVGETNDSLLATIEGDDLEINFNHRYITDCFQSIADDSVTLFLNGLSKPLIIKGVSDKSFLYLVMPMNK